MATGLSVAKKFRALKCWLLSNSKALPWIWLSPDLVTSVMDEEPASPWSASAALVVMFTTSTSSAGTTLAHVMRQPDVNAFRAVDLCDIGLRVAAVDVGAQGAPGRVGDRILECRGRRAGYQIDQSLIVPEAAQRHVHDARRGKLGVRVRFIRLELNRFRGDCYRLACFADLKVKIETANGVWCDRETRLLYGSKTLGNGFNRVGTGKEVDEAIPPA